MNRSKLLGLYTCAFNVKSSPIWDMKQSRDDSGELCSFEMHPEMCSYEMHLKRCSHEMHPEMCSHEMYLKMCSHEMHLKMCSHEMHLKMCSHEMHLKMLLWNAPENVQPWNAPESALECILGCPSISVFWGYFVAYVEHNQMVFLTQAPNSHNSIIL